MKERVLARGIAAAKRMAFKEMYLVSTASRLLAASAGVTGIQVIQAGTYDTIEAAASHGLAVPGFPAIKLVPTINGT